MELQKLQILVELRSCQVPCVESIDERSEEPTFTHRVTATQFRRLLEFLRAGV